MLPLDTVKKYATLDQLIVYEILYDRLIKQRLEFVKAADEVNKVDKKRDRSAVQKILRALNERFEKIFEVELLYSDADGSWCSTNVGDEVYLLSRQISSAFEAFQDSASRLLPSQEEINLYVRKSLGRMARELLIDDGSPAFDQKVNTHTFSESQPTEPFASWSETNIVVDQLFITDKRNINSRDFYYFILGRRPINVGISKSNTNLLSKLSERDGGKRGIDVKYLSNEHLIVPKTTLGIRTALAIAHNSMAVDSYLDQGLMTALKGSIPKINFSVESFDQLWQAPEIHGDYAVLLSDESISVLNKELGDGHIEATVYSGEQPQSFDEVAIIRRDALTAASGTAMHSWVQFLKRRERKLSDVKIKIDTNVSDRTSEFFQCSACHNAIHYDEFSVVFPLVRECRNCMRVQQFDPFAEGAPKVSTKRDIKDIKFADFDADEVVHCEVHDCGAPLPSEFRRGNKGYEYKICSSCHTVYQPQKAQPRNVLKSCPADNCETEHSFRISDVKPETQIPCFNSFKMLKYNDETKDLTIGRGLKIVDIILPDPALYNEFHCPHLGCGAKMRRRVFKNRAGQWFSHCRACKNQIRIKGGAAHVDDSPVDADILTSEI